MDFNYVHTSNDWKVLAVIYTDNAASKEIYVATYLGNIIIDIYNATTDSSTVTTISPFSAGSHKMFITFTGTTIEVEIDQGPITSANIPEHSMKEYIHLFGSVFGGYSTAELKRFACYRSELSSAQKTELYNH